MTKKIFLSFICLTFLFFIFIIPKSNAEDCTYKVKIEQSVNITPEIVKGKCNIRTYISLIKECGNVSKYVLLDSHNIDCNCVEIEKIKQKEMKWAKSTKNIIEEYLSYVQ